MAYTSTRALLIVDVQNDFLPGGALPAPEGKKIIPVINKLVNRFELIVASKDWHPEKTVHFQKWPPHCIRDTEGADFPKELAQNKFTRVVLKGTGDKDDGYSAFEATNLNLEEFLKKNGVNQVFITGLTTEYCIKNTALDAVKNGFETYVVEDAIEAVNEKQEDVFTAFEEMKNNGVRFVNSGNT